MTDFPRIEFPHEMARNPVFSTAGIRPDGRLSILGVSVQLSEAEVHWRDFHNGLVGCGLRDVQCVTSDEHTGPKAARRAVIGGVKWQRCKFHISQNAIHHVPSAAICNRIGSEMRAVWNAVGLPAPQRVKAELMAKYCEAVLMLADWLDESVDEGLTVYTMSERYRRWLRTSNSIEWPVNQKIKRHTAAVLMFPGLELLLHPEIVILVEIDERWSLELKDCIRMEYSHD